MCRCKSDHHARRCPSSHGERRSAVDRARRAAQRAAQTTSPTAAHATDVTPAQSLPDLIASTRAAYGTRDHDLYRLQQLLDRRAQLTNGTESPDAPQAWTERLAACNDAIDRLTAKIAADEAVHPYVSPDAGHAALLSAGQQVATRAEQIAGITADEARASYQARLAAANDAVAHAVAAVKAKEVELGMEQAAQAYVEARHNRTRATDDTPPEVLDAVHATIRKYSALQDELTEYTRQVGLHGLKDAARRIRDGCDEQTVKDLTALAHGYQQALTEVRPTGGAFAVQPKSSKAAVALVNDAVQVYPSEWIEASNNRRAPLVRASDARAHYTDGTVKTTRKRVPVVDHYVVPDGVDPYEHSYEDPATAVFTPAAEQGHRYPGERLWDVTRYERFSAWEHRNRDGVPVGPGWEQVTVTRFGRTEQVWRRPKYKMKTVDTHVTPELTTNFDYSPVGQVGYRVAVHELAHRMEASVPMIGRMEADFLERRTTRPDGSRNPLTNLYGTKKEQARDGGFVDAYMGKEYADSPRYFEVLSTGSEGLFSGSFGGLVGLSADTPPDLEHRAFVLGVFATATNSTVA